MFTIEKNIPIPEKGAFARGGTPKYPWNEMKVGDSFLVLFENYVRRASANPPKYSVELALRYAVESGWRNWAKRNASPKKFRVRRVDGGVRVWRVS